MCDHTISSAHRCTRASRALATLVLAFVFASSESRAQRAWRGEEPRPAVDAVSSLARRGGPVGQPARARGRVRVSRQELRAEFRTDTTQPWGWSDRGELEYAARYIWTIRMDGMDGPYTLNHWVMRSEPGTRVFPSLAAVVASSVSTMCGP